MHQETRTPVCMVCSWGSSHMTPWGLGEVGERGGECPSSALTQLPWSCLRWGSLPPCCESHLPLATLEVQARVPLGGPGGSWDQQGCKRLPPVHLTLELGQTANSHKSLWFSSTVLYELRLLKRVWLIINLWFMNLDHKLKIIYALF